MLCCPLVCWLCCPLYLYSDDMYTNVYSVYSKFADSISIFVGLFAASAPWLSSGPGSFRRPEASKQNATCVSQAAA